MAVKTERERERERETERERDRERERETVNSMNKMTSRPSDEKQFGWRSLNEDDADMVEINCAELVRQGDSGVHCDCTEVIGGVDTTLD